MTPPITLALIAVLAAISLLHVGWAFGLRWPAAKGVSLAETVGGVRPGGRMHGRGSTLFVAAAIMGCAVLVWLVSVANLPMGAIAFAAVGAYGLMTLVFLLRGLSAYIPALWRRVEGTPFHRLNRLYYSPLCLLIAAGLIANIWNS